jgi:hypothetical protein
MKNIYSLFTLFLLFFAVSLFGQSRVYAPELRAPEDAEIQVFPNVMLDWDAVTGETIGITYEAQIATQEDFSDAFVFPRTDLTAIQTEVLLFGQKYYWRVMAFDGDNASDWSEVWSFTVINTVNIKAPKIGAEVYASQEVTWEEITGLTKYQLELDTSYVWNQVTTGAESNVLATFVLNENNMWLVGESGLIQHFDGTAWNTMDAGITVDLSAVYFIDEANGYAVGEDGTVLFFDGVTWSIVDAGATKDLTGVSFADVNHGWVVGADGLVLTYTDGVWAEAETTNTEDLTGVTAVSATDVWACGNGSVVLHFNGTDWTVSEVGTKDLFTIWFNDASNGWVTGDNGKLHYYNGTEWVEQTTGTTKDLFGISMSGMTGFAVGQSGTMISYDGGSWAVVTSGTTVDLNGIWLKDDVGLSGGASGTVIKKSGEGFDSPFNHIYNVSRDSVGFELTNLPFGSKIYYRMRAMHTRDTSNWSSPRSMVTFAAPSLSKPSNSSTNLDLTNEFKWKEYKGAVDYYYEISSDEEFTSPTSWIVDSLSINTKVFLFGHTYYWRVKADHPGDISDWSDVWSYTTKSAVTLKTPKNDATDIASCPLYTWEEIVGSSGYQIMIDSDPEFSNAVDKIVTKPSYQCQTPMQRNTVYYWKVRAASTQDTTAWSEVWSFKTEGYIGVDEEFGDESVTIYPNPNKGTFSLNIYSFKQEEVNIAVTDLTGKVVYQELIYSNSGDNKKEINLTNLQNGLYLVSVRKGNEVVTKKLFVH